MSINIPFTGCPSGVLGEIEEILISRIERSGWNRKLVIFYLEKMLSNIKDTFPRDYLRYHELGCKCEDCLEYKEVHYRKYGMYKEIGRASCRERVYVLV